MKCCRTEEKSAAGRRCLGCCNGRGAAWENNDKDLRAEKWMDGNTEFSSRMTQCRKVGGVCTTRKSSLTLMVGPICASRSLSSILSGSCFCFSGSERDSSCSRETSIASKRRERVCVRANERDAGSATQMCNRKTCCRWLLRYVRKLFYTAVVFTEIGKFFRTLDLCREELGTKEAAAAFQSRAH